VIAVYEGITGGLPPSLSSIPASGDYSFSPPVRSLPRGFDIFLENSTKQLAKSTD